MKLDEYQKKAMTTALNVGNGTEALYYRTLGLAGEAGEVADKVKKIIRDKGGKISAEDKKIIASELGDVLWYTATLAEYLGLSLSQIAKGNNKKLADRRSRGAIGGSGDER